MKKKLTKNQMIKKVQEYLEENRLMTLGVCWRNKPWGATVFYAYDEKLNLLFYSRPDTKHCQYIHKNPNVSVVINHNWRYPDGKIRGLQILGKAKKVSKKDYPILFEIFRKRFKWADRFTRDHILYLIKPSEIWYLDEQLFGHFYRVKVL